MTQTIFPLATALFFCLSFLGCGRPTSTSSAPKQLIGNSKATVGNFIYALQPGSSVLVDVKVRVYPKANPSAVFEFVLKPYQTNEIKLDAGRLYSFEISWPSGSINKDLQVAGDSILMIVGGLNSFPDIITKPDQAGIEIIHLAALRPKLADRVLYLCTQPNAAQVRFPYGSVQVAEAPGATAQDVWLYAGRYMSDKANCQDRLLTIKAIKLPKIAATNEGQIYIVGTASLNLPLRVVLNHDVYDADSLFLPLIFGP